MSPEALSSTKNIQLKSQCISIPQSHSGIKMPALIISSYTTLIRNLLHELFISLKINIYGFCSVGHIQLLVYIMYMPFESIFANK
ncbi:hypothetical protein D9M68_542740 [compost metagenome]